MLNIKEIAATLAILGSGTLMVGCEKDAPATETPAAGDTAGTPEASCGEKKDGSCGEGKTPEASCGEGKTPEASCGEGKTPEASCGEKPQ
jgi:uncharacterized low-complexity protein